jgi:hypothetical protein
VKIFKFVGERDVAEREGIEESGNDFIFVKQLARVVPAFAKVMLNS